MESDEFVFDMSAVLRGEAAALDQMIRRHKMSQRFAARVLGVTDRALRLWLTARVRQPLTVRLVVQLVLAERLSLRDLRVFASNGALPDWEEPEVKREKRAASAERRRLVKEKIAAFRRAAWGDEAV